MEMPIRKKSAPIGVDRAMTDSANATSGDSSSTIEAIHVYWRPGCPFCMTLDRGLRDIEIPVIRHNIWDDPEAAAFVRSAANGNETVPTVRIGSETLVNPSVRDVAATVARLAPEQADEVAALTTPGPLGRLLGRLSGDTSTN